MSDSVSERPRLDIWLAERRGISRHAAQTLIEAGAVSVNRRPGKSSQRVSGADLVEVDEVTKRVPGTPPGPPVELRVVFEDEWLAIVDKPAGLVVHPAPGHPHGTLADGLRQRGVTWSLLGGDERAGIVHRLDRDTSGLLVVAKTEVAHRHLAAQLQRRSLGRTYWALVHGGFAEASGRIEAPIGRDLHDRKQMAVADRGREAVTDFVVVARHARSTELEVELRTGRTHQIRVHLGYIGHPVAGDPVYGRRDRATRLGLHARRLRFLHPHDGAERIFESPLPDELQELRLAAAEVRL